MRQDMLETITPLLRRSGSRDYPVVLMTCGIAGPGKSTLAEAVISELPYFARLSIDEIIFEKHGLYGVDYPANDKLYQQYQEEADKIFVDMFRKLLEEDKDIVLDRSFYAKEDRKEYKHMIEDGGGKWVLVYLKAGSKEELWNRICERSAKRKEADSAMEILRNVFETYWTGFEEPQGEGEVVIEVCHHLTEVLNTHPCPEQRMNASLPYSCLLYHALLKTPAIDFLGWIYMLDSKIRCPELFGPNRPESF